MNKLSITALVLVPAILFSAVKAQNGPDSVLSPTKRFSKRVLVSGLAGPWELTWGPDNMLWVTERIGKRVTRIDPVTGQRRVAITIDDVSVIGGQDGLLGLALHPELLRGKGHEYVYLAYTYIDKEREPHAGVTDPQSPYRYLYGKIVRFSYDAAKQELFNPVDLIRGLPAGDDHLGGRLKIGPDGKLYFTVGDQGHNQFANFCLPIESQRLPSRKEVTDRNYQAYAGKSLRLNLDGSVPVDNPMLNGVVSHVFTYGHRNPQGLDFSPDGTLYSSEHGPKTDDEINILKAGANYGWPFVAGFKDDKSYVYARWAGAGTLCSQLTYNDLDQAAIPSSVPQQPESAFREPSVEPIATMFTVSNGYNFHDPACKDINFVCWPTVGVSDIEYYESNGKGVPGWDKVLLVSTLKRGSLYVLPLTSDGQSAAGYFSRYFRSEDRFRDTAVDSDRKTIYIATDASGVVEGASGPTTELRHPGAILAFTYEGEGAPMEEEAREVTGTAKSGAGTSVTGSTAGGPPLFTAAQAAKGKTAYNAHCTVCHGGTMANGTYGPPLAGDYFKTKWSHQSARALYDRVRNTMPPAHPGSLPANTCAAIVAYILEVNGFKAGETPLPTGGEKIDQMILK